MVYFSEILSNPEGEDAKGEWIELGNSGDLAVDLSGWSVVSASGKKALLSGKIDPGALAVFSRSTTKLSLRNTDEYLSLYDRGGNVVMRADLRGTAHEGSSFNYKEGGFFRGTPTPGAPNRFDAPALLVREYPRGVPLVSQSSFPLLGALLGTALLCAGGLLFIVKTNATLRNLFFSRDEKARG